MFSCFNENASPRSWDISCGERDAGSEAKSRRRAEMRKGWLDGKCLDLVVLVRPSKVIEFTIGENQSDCSNHSSL